MWTTERVGASRCLALVVSVLWAVSAHAQGTHPILDVAGFQQNRDYFSEAPFEHIDTLSGGLILTFTDLVLPGNAGRDLRFQRTYNSKSTRWSFGIAGVPLYISHPPISGVVYFQDQAPALLFADGSERRLGWQVIPNPLNPSAPTVAVSKDFWVYRQPSLQLEIPDGRVCQYAAVTGGARVTSCSDQFGNAVVFGWSPPPGPITLTVTQTLSASESRVVTVSDIDGGRLPAALTYGTRTWTYSAAAVAPPGGLPGWAFEYAGSGTARLSRVTTPHGGVIDYTYDTETYHDVPTTYYTEVVRTRSTGGTLVAGTWNYDYQILQNGNSDVTTVDTPSARVIYTHGTGWSSAFIFDGEAGVVPLVQRLVQRPLGGGAFEDVEHEARTYQFVPVMDCCRSLKTDQPIAVLLAEN
jgi:Domain of unknown function (DUF6531)